MKVGDLVKCLFQPLTSKIQHGVCIPMKHTIKGELGIVVAITSAGTPRVLFPRFGYEHPLACSALEKLSDQAIKR